jgi:hypothetical protein
MTIEARVASWMPMPAWMAGIVFAVVLTGLGLVLHALSGVPPFEDGPTVRITPQTHVTFLCASLLAYGLTVARLMAETGDFPSMSRPSRLASRIAGVVGVGAGVTLIFLTARQIRIQEPGRNPWNAGELYVDLLSLLFLWGLGRAAYFTLRGAGAEEFRKVSVDLWNIAPLYQYGRRGLRNALAWSLGISLLVAIMFFDPNPGLQVDSVKVLVPLFLGSVVVASLALFLPLWALRLRVQAEKTANLNLIAHQLRRLRDERQSGLPSMPGVEADLIARRTFIDGVSEWAIDTGTFRKLSLYLLFPAGSWFVGPILRKMVDAVVFESVVRNLIDLFR